MPENKKADIEEHPARASSMSAYSSTGLSGCRDALRLVFRRIILRTILMPYHSKARNARNAAMDG